MDDYDLIVELPPGDEERRLQMVCARLRRMGLELNLVPATGHYQVAVVVGEVGVSIAEPKSLQDVLCLWGYLTSGPAGQALIAEARRLAGGLQ